MLRKTEKKKQPTEHFRKEKNDGRMENFGGGVVEGEETER